MAIKPPPLEQVTVDDKKQYSKPWYNYWVYLSKRLDNVAGIATEKSDTFSTAATSWTDITGLSAAIAPSSTGATIKIRAVLQVSVSASHSVGFRITRNGTAIMVGDTASSRTSVTASMDAGVSAAQMATVVLEGIDTPSTTNPTTYQVQVNNLAAGTTYLNRSGTDTDSAAFARGYSIIHVCEIA